eukprot:326365-Pleurochrysis_carterae.AAC.1
MCFSFSSRSLTHPLSLDRSPRLATFSRARSHSSQFACVQISPISLSSVDAIVLHLNYIRVVRLLQLLDLVKKWKDQWETSVSSSPDGASNPANPNSGTRERMVLPDYFQPARPFEVAKIGKKPPMWQISHQKFESGDSLDKIAISQARFRTNL